MGIGKRIKKAREDKNLTQKDLSVLIGVTPSAITNYENETSHPKEEILYKLIKVLNVDANYLFQDAVDLPNSQNAFTSDERLYIKKYRSLDNRGKDIVDTILNKEYEYSIEHTSTNTDNNIVEMQKPMTPEETKEAWGFEESARDTYGKKSKYNTNFTFENVEKMKEALDLLKRGEFNNGDHKR